MGVHGDVGAQPLAGEPALGHALGRGGADEIPAGGRRAHHGGRVRRVRDGRGDRRGDLDYHRGRSDGGGSGGCAPVPPGLPPLGDVPRLALQEGCCERVRITEARVDVVPGRERGRRRGGRGPERGRIGQLRPVLELRVRVVPKMRHVAPRPFRLRPGTFGRGRENRTARTVAPTRSSRFQPTRTGTLVPSGGFRRGDEVARWRPSFPSSPSVVPPRPDRHREKTTPSRGAPSDSNTRGTARPERESR